MPPVRERVKIDQSIDIPCHTHVTDMSQKGLKHSGEMWFYIGNIGYIILKMFFLLK